jgi:hypothetical protein
MTPMHDSTTKDESTINGPDELVESLKYVIQELEDEEAGASEEAILDALQDDFDVADIKHQLHLLCREGVIFAPRKREYRVLSGFDMMTPSTDIERRLVHLAGGWMHYETTRAQDFARVEWTRGGEKLTVKKFGESYEFKHNDESIVRTTSESRLYFKMCEHLGLEDRFETGEKA